jgi:hypothetical protein
MPWGVGATPEKARSGQGNPRESKEIPLIVFAPFCPDFAGFW